MKSVRQVLFGIAAALLSAIIVLGSFSLAMTEGMQRVAQLPSTEVTETSLAVVSPLVSLIQTATRTESPSTTHTPGPVGVESPTLTSTATPRPSATVTLTATPTNICTAAPGDWIEIVVQAGETWEKLSVEHNIIQQALMDANCLTIESPIPGTVLFVPGPRETQTTPPPVTSTSPDVECTPPNGYVGWVVYIVRRGETLFSLSRELGVTVTQLQTANCMGRSTLLITSQELWVPYLPSRQVPPPPTATQQPASPTSELPTPTEELPTPTLTIQPSPAPTSTIPPTPSPAPTEVPPTPTEAPTPTPITPEPTIETVEPIQTEEPVITEQPG